VKICLAQLNYRIGDFEANARKIRDAIQQAKRAGAELIVFSELAVCGYPPEDLLDYDDFIRRCEKAMDEMAHEAQGISVVIGSISRNPDAEGRRIANAAYVLRDGSQFVQWKTLLPTYDVFHEARYFEPAETIVPFTVDSHPLGVLVCEDTWERFAGFQYAESPIDRLQAAHIRLLLNPSASPFNEGKGELRDAVLRDTVTRLQAPVIYVNQLGAHADLIFDGGSTAMNSRGEIVLRLPRFQEALGYVFFDGKDITAVPDVEAWPLERSGIALLREALVFGLREYCQKTGFRSAVLGSSGGIDSAVVQALATEALGANQVHAMLMPSDFSSEGSINDARQLSQNLGNSYEMVPIAGLYDAFNAALQPVFKDKAVDVTEENIQARIRGILLMAASNKFGHLLLNTSNKSEMAVGYSTLYGDLCGGISIIGDVFKTRVYELARHINEVHGPVIPEAIIRKAPSAELRPDQKDSDSLPPYEELDPLLQAYIEECKGKETLIAEGFPEALVNRVLKLVDRSEYKRYQAPPILRVSRRAFGQGRKMPLVAHYG
jgi:NAD+ synthase (glutamine-hydrolysing)